MDSDDSIIAAALARAGEWDALECFARVRRVLAPAPAPAPAPGGRAEGGGRVLAGHEVRVSALAAHPVRPWLFSGGRDGRVCVWDVDHGVRTAAIDFVSMPKGHVVSCIAVDPDGTRVAVGRGPFMMVYHNVGYWRSELCHLVRDDREESPRVSSIAWSHDGTWLVGAGDKEVPIRPCVVRVQGPGGATSVGSGQRAHACVSHPIENWFACGRSGGIDVYSFATGERIRTLVDESCDVAALAANACYIVAADGASGRLSVWDWLGGAPLRRLSFDHPFASSSLAWRGRTLGICNGAGFFALDTARDPEDWPTPELLDGDGSTPAPLDVIAGRPRPVDVAVAVLDGGRVAHPCPRERSRVIVHPARR